MGTDIMGDLTKYKASVSVGLLGLLVVGKTAMDLYFYLRERRTVEARRPEVLA